MAQPPLGAIFSSVDVLRQPVRMTFLKFSYDKQ